MKRTIPLALALAVGLPAVALAQTSLGALPNGSAAILAMTANPGAAVAAPTTLREGQHVVVIGEISSAPKTVAGVREERKMQVAVGPARTDYTLHLGDAALIGANALKIEVDDLVDKTWVRAEGTVMDDPRRVKVTRLQVLGKDQAGYRTSRFWNAANPRGFVAAVSAPAVAIRQPAGTPPAGTAALPRFAEGTAVVVVGEITSQPKDIIDEDKMQVALGPAKTDVTLHLSDAKMYSQYGAAVKEDHLANKMWVRAEGTVMDDARRIKVTRLQVIGTDMPGLQRSVFYRPGFDQGYMVAVAGARQIFPVPQGAAFTPAPLVIVGTVSSDTGPLEATRKIQVDTVGNIWTVHVPKDTPVIDAKGEKVSVHEVAKSQWVRVHGWQTDDLRVRAARIQNIGPDQAYRTSTFYRAGEPVGYVERMPGTGARFSPVQVTGVVTFIDSTNGLVRVRDEGGQERTFYLETVTVFVDGRLVEPAGLRQGQRVTIHGSDIAF